MHVTDRSRSSVRPRPRSDSRRTPASLAAVSGGSDSVALAHLLRELDAAGELRSPGSRTSTTSFARRRTTTSGSCAQLAASLGVPLLADREDVAALRAARAAVDRRRRAHRALRVLRAGARCTAAPTWSRSATRATIRPKRFCCGCCAAPGRAAWRRCIRDTARSSGRCSTAGARAARRSCGARAAAVRRRRDERRRQHPAQSRARRAAAAARGAVQPGHRRRAGRRGRAGARDLAVDGRRWRRRSRHASCVRVAGRDSEPVREIDVARLGGAAAGAAARGAVAGDDASWPAAGRFRFDHVEAALRLTDQRDDGRVDAPGQRVERIGHALVLTGRSADATGRVAGGTKRTFSGIRCLSLERSRCRRPAVWCRPNARRRHRADGECSPCSSWATGPARGARSPRPLRGPFGRTKSPPGRPVPARSGSAAGRSCRTISWTGKSRATSATRCRSSSTKCDRIVWVAGYGIDEAFRVTDPAQAVLILRLKALGGSA